MENSQPQSELQGEMSFEQKIFQDFNTAGHSGFRHQIFGQEGGGYAFPHHRLVILGLGLLNAALLIAAAVIGIYCAKDGYLEVPNAAATPFIIEMNYLRNHSDIIRATEDAQAALEQERVIHIQLKLNVQKQVALNDILQSQIETLHTEKTNLLSSKTILEESCGRCLPGWLFLNSSCYYFSSRHEPDTKKNWLDSKSDCVQRGGDLLVINNVEEQKLICENIPKLSTSLGWRLKGSWINCAEHEGKWVWVVGSNATQVVEPMYWRRGQPDITGPEAGQCVAFYYQSLANTRETWYNGNCQADLLNWICEKSP